MLISFTEMSAESPSRTSVFDAVALFTLGMLLSHKIMLTMIVWTIASAVISSGSDFEMFFTLEVIGLLVVREFVDSFATISTKERLDLFIYAGLFVFIVIVLRRVWLAVS